MLRAAALVLAFALATPALAAPVDALFAGRPSADPVNAVPACDSVEVLETIRARFASAELTPPGLAIAAIEQPRQARFVVNQPSPVARRYCAARTLLSNGKRPGVHYLIERNAGFAGYGWNVEFCLSGHDRWHVHDGRCRTAAQY